MNRRNVSRSIALAGLGLLAIVSVLGAAILAVARWLGIPT